MEGWIKFYRRFLEWEWYDDINVCRLFLHLLLSANFEERKWQGITVGRGEIIVGRQQLSKETRLSEQQVRTALNKLKSTNEITIKSTNRFSVITICNYAKYQDTEMIEQPTKQPSNQPSNQPTINQQSTNNQPTNNQQITTTKELKNDKNDKNSVVRFTPPSIDEVKAYCMERQNTVDPIRFVNFYSMKGWMVGKNKMRDWKAAVRTWEQSHSTSKPTTLDNRFVKDIWENKL